MVTAITVIPARAGDGLGPGDQLGPGGVLASPDGRHRLAYQGDGDLVLHQDGAARWASETGGTPPGVCRMQADGNLVVYTPGAVPVWASGTDGHPGSRLVVQDDGNVVIYAPDGRPVWATGTNRRTIG